jgi:hypothetical protein
MFYGFLSLESHGGAFGIDSKGKDNDHEIYSLVAMSNSFIECIRYIVKKWITKISITENKIIRRILMGET